MKIVLIVCLVGLFVYLARMVARYYCERFTFFVCVKEMLENFLLNMDFKKEKLKNFVSSSKNNKIQFNQFISQYESYLTNDTKPNLSSIAILNENESEYLQNMLVALGKNDAMGERAQLKSFGLQIDRYLEKARFDKEKKVPLILKIGFLTGLLVAILFV